MDVSCREMLDIVDALSETARRAVPGMSLRYSERLIQETPGRDVKYCSVLREGLSRPPVPVRGAMIESRSAGKARAKLLRRLALDGWPEAKSAEEMRLKLAAAGDGAFAGVCAMYASAV